MARLVAFGDSHLGRTYLAHLRDDEGRNLREEDFLRSFDWAIDATLETEPDGFLLLGDIFDHARPTYRTFSKVLGGLKRLRDAGLRGFAISGNHDTPRVRGTGSPYAALEEVFDNVDFAWNTVGRTGELAGLAVHAVPHALSIEDFREQLEQAAGRVRADLTNVAIAHVALTSVPAKYDLNELEVEESVFDKRFDLMLLGHYHVHQKVSKRTWYAGSIDSFNFSDTPAGAGAKGVMIVNTDSSEIELIENPGERPLVTYSVLAAGMGPGELVAAVESAGAQAPEGSIARVYLNQVDPAAYRQVSQEEFAEAIPGAVAVTVHPDAAADVFSVQGGVQIGRLDSEWNEYVGTQDLAGLERDRIVAMGRDFLEAAQGETV